MGRTILEKNRKVLGSTGIIPQRGLTVRSSSDMALGHGCTVWQARLENRLYKFDAEGRRIT